MSRYYEMSVKVGVKNLDEGYAAQEALCDEWPFDGDMFPHGYHPDDTPMFWLNGRSNLCGGESEEEFAARCYRAVLKALRRPTTIEVHCTYLEDIPYEIYTCDEAEAERILRELE